MDIKYNAGKICFSVNSRRDETNNLTYYLIICVWAEQTQFMIPRKNFTTQLCNFCFLPDETGALLLKTAECHRFSDDYHGVEDVAHSPAHLSYLMISGFISLPCQFEETQEAFETV